MAILYSFFPPLDSHIRFTFLYCAFTLLLFPSLYFSFVYIMLKSRYVYAFTVALFFESNYGFLKRILTFDMRKKEKNSNVYFLICYLKVAAEIFNIETDIQLDLFSYHARQTWQLASGTVSFPYR